MGHGIGRTMHPDLLAKCDRSVEAGTFGRLLRAAMALARSEPEWLATGPVERFETPQGARLRQRFRRPDPEIEPL